MWRWGWGALIAGVLLFPVGQQGNCYEAAPSHGDSYCETHRLPLLGLILPIQYPAVWSMYKKAQGGPEISTLIHALLQPTTSYSQLAWNVNMYMTYPFPHMPFR